MITNIGLVLDIIGALIIWKYGLPSAVTKSTHPLIFRNPTEKEKQDVNISPIMAHLGIVFLILGFCLQFLGNNL